MKTIATIAFVLVGLSSPALGADESEAGVAALPAAAASASAGSVARAQITTAVVGREPQDSVDRISGDVDSLAYFTELVGLEGHTVSHVWEHQGNEMARVSFEVGGARWRVHSTKRFDSSWVGAWRVTVVDQNGEELRSDHFYYAEEDAAAATASPAAASDDAPPAAPE